MSISPPITWFGGKSKLAARIVGHFPDHRTYVEPFGGSAAVLLAKPPSPVEVYNDIDHNLVNLFRVLREPELFERLRVACEATLYSRAEFYLAQQPAHDPVEAARRFIVRQRQSHGGVGRAWSYCVADAQTGMSSAVRRWLSGIERLPAIHRRLRRVQIEAADWSEVLVRYDRPDTLFYLDPPYVAETRVGGGYRHELGQSDHVRLIEAVQSLSGMVILSGYPSDAYQTLEDQGWRRVEYDVPAYMSPRRDRRRESLWISPAAQSGRGAAWAAELGVADERRARAAMRAGAYITHSIRVAVTEERLREAITQLRSEGRRVSKSEVGRRTGISREHLCRRYRHLFEGV